MTVGGGAKRGWGVGAGAGGGSNERERYSEIERGYLLRGRERGEWREREYSLKELGWGEKGGLGDGTQSIH